MKKFIVTDPCYIMNEHQYEAICKFGCNFDKQPMPLITSRRRDQVPVIIHLIKNTPNGDGSYVYNGEEIGVDSGMLCIAEVLQDDDWGNEKLGATFNSFEGAEEAFYQIKRQF